MTEFQAAVLRAQFKRFPAQVKRRQAAFEKFESLLGAIPGVSSLTVDPRVTQRSGYQYIFRYERSAFAGASKPEVLRALRAEGIPADEGYSPLNRHHELFPLATWDQWYDAGARVPHVDPTACPIAHQAAEESIWLPHELFLGPDKDIQDVAEAIAKVQRNAHAIPRDDSPRQEQPS